MKRKKDEGERYLLMYPALRKKWINQCSICQTQGYKPDLPAKAIGEAVKNLRRMFKELRVDTVGRCDDCAQHDL